MCWRCPSTAAVGVPCSAPVMHTAMKTWCGGSTWPFREQSLSQPMRLHPSPPFKVPTSQLSSQVQENKENSITGTFSFSLRLSLSLEDWSRVILGRSPRRSGRTLSLCFVSASGPPGS